METDFEQLLPPLVDPRTVAETLRTGGLLGLLQLAPPPPRMSIVLNRVVDQVFHPWAERQPDPVRKAAVYLVDGVVHFLVEMNDQAVISLWKFAVYNLPKILGALGVGKVGGR